MDIFGIAFCMLKHSLNRQAITQELRGKKNLSDSAFIMSLLKLDFSIGLCAAENEAWFNNKASFLSTTKIIKF